jgi:micrococcal nuclease
MLGQRAALVTDPTQDMTDRYGRTLAYLDKADGWDDSIEAARAGAAHSYIYHDHPAERADEVAAAEKEAKTAGRGLWGHPASARRLQFHAGEGNGATPSGR